MSANPNSQFGQGLLLLLLHFSKVLIIIIIIILFYFILLKNIFIQFELGFYEVGLLMAQACSFTTHNKYNNKIQRGNSHFPTTSSSEGSVE